MTSARYPLPTDLVALVSFDGRVYPNEAKTWDRLGLHDRGPHPLETALEQWFSFATGKHTWVSVRGATIRGVISARRRAKRSAWEVEVLIDASDDKDVVLSLLRRMTAGVTKLGAERVFLRLAADSHLLDIAREAGFFTYSSETLYRHAGPLRAGSPCPAARPRTKTDTLGIFHLYTRSVPASVRAIEGPTLREWLAALEPWGGRPTDIVLEEDGVIAAWLRLLPGQPARFSLLQGQASIDLDAVAREAAARLSGSRSYLCLAPSYGQSLAVALKGLGFEPAGEYVALAKRLLRPAEEMTPEKVSSAVPVS